jgi:hypothetical protein
MTSRPLPLFGTSLLVVMLGCHAEQLPLTPNQYFQQRANAVCSAVTSACLVPLPTCTAGRVAEYTAEYQAALSAVRDFIPDNAEACLTKVKDVYGKLDQGAVALKAADYLAMEASCANVYRGASAANGVCAEDVDCIGTLVCDKGFCGTPKLVAPGAGCANIGEHCPTGSYCSSATGVWLCTPESDLQGSCVQSPCLESLRCAAGVCVARLDIAAACTGDGDCASGFCEPYAHQCAEDIRFANHSAACVAMGGTG